MIAKRKTKRVKAGGNSFCYQIMILAIRLWNNYTMIGQNDLPLFDYMGRRWKTIALLIGHNSVGCEPYCNARRRRIL